MGLAQRSVGLGGGYLSRWRSQFDFDAPGLTARSRLARLEYAAEQASRQCVDEAGQYELEFILRECRELLRMKELEGEPGELARVRQRTERIRRVVLYYEGGISCLNRRFWWIPSVAALAVMACCVVQSLGAL